MSLWYCEVCKKNYHHQGVAMHRRTHRDKKERVSFLAGIYRYTYDYREGKS